MLKRSFLKTMLIAASMNINSEENTSAAQKTVKLTEEIVAELRQAKAMSHILRNAGMSHTKQSFLLQYTDAVEECALNNAAPKPLATLMSDVLNLIPVSKFIFALLPSNKDESPAVTVDMEIRSCEPTSDNIVLFEEQVYDDFALCEITKQRVTEDLSPIGGKPTVLTKKTKRCTMHIPLNELQIINQRLKQQQKASK